MAPKKTPLPWKTFFALLALAMALGGVCRFTDLAKRPMHTDEAILAVKTQTAWQTKHFEYDPKDFHGPFLHKAAQWLGGLRGWSPDTLDEGRLRWVVAIFGMAMILLPLLLIDVLGRAGTVIASLLIAVSPMMVYFSRYYIMETPLVFLTGLFIACLWRWSQKRNYFWLVLGGFCLGGMHAAKETFVLNLAAMIVGWIAVKMAGCTFQPKSDRYSFSSSKRRPSLALPWFIILFVAALTSVWLYSSGFRDWQAVVDSVGTYRNYLVRSAGSGHEKAWHYYITLLFYRQNTFIWTEALIGGLAIVGMVSSFADDRRDTSKRGFLIFLSVYAVVLLMIYSGIPYKTPWSIMGVDFAFALLAGVGMKTIYRGLTAPAARIVVNLLFAAGVFHLCQQTSLATDYKFPNETRYASDERNPYVYSHTSPNLVVLAKTIHELAAMHPEGLSMPVQVIQSEQGWPLPWYLRDMKNVGYQSHVPETLNAAVVVTDIDKEEAVRVLVTPKAQAVVEAEPPPPPPIHGPVLDVPPSGENPAIIEHEVPLPPAPEPVAPPPPPAPVFYVGNPYGLRPGITLTLLVKNDLWDAYLEKKAKPQPGRRD